MIRKSRYQVSTSCSNKKMERDDDRIKVVTPSCVNFVTRLSNLLGRFGFKVFIHAFQDALPTGKSLSPDESEGTELLRRLPRPAIPGDGRMGLSAQLAFFEVRALVFFVSQQDFQVQMQIDCLSGGNLHKKFSR
jgi:hypothetical protein